MCEYMINFIHKLKHLPEKYMMNSVLENFTILLVMSHFDLLAAFRNLEFGEGLVLFLFGSICRRWNVMYLK